MFVSLTFVSSIFANIFSGLPLASKETFTLMVSLIDRPDPIMLSKVGIIPPLTLPLISNLSSPLLTAASSQSTYFLRDYNLYDFARETKKLVSPSVSCSIVKYSLLSPRINEVCDEFGEALFLTFSVKFVVSNFGKGRYVYYLVLRLIILPPI